MDELLPEWLLKAGHSIRSQSRMSKAIGIFTGAAIPIIVATLVAFYGQISTISVFLFWIPLVFFCALAALISYFAVEGEPASELLVPFLQEREEKKAYRNATASLLALQELISMWQTGTDNYIQQKILAKKDALSAVELIMGTLSSSSDALFQFDRNELWNFAVYVFDDKNQELVPVWRQKHPNHPSKDLGRTWKQGIGHVGIAFSAGEAKITGNARAAEVVQFLRLPAGQDRSYDNTAYVSFISQPILRIAGGVPLGVVAATSNTENRFNQISGLAIRHAAAELGAILSLACQGTILP